MTRVILLSPMWRLVTAALAASPNRRAVDAADTGERRAEADRFILHERKLLGQIIRREKVNSRFPKFGRYDDREEEPIVCNLKYSAHFTHN
jgi:hypothetical protein